MICIVPNRTNSILIVDPASCAPYFHSGNSSIFFSTFFHSSSCSFHPNACTLQWKQLRFFTAALFQPVFFFYICYHFSHRLSSNRWKNLTLRLHYFLRLYYITLIIFLTFYYHIQSIFSMKKRKMINCFAFDNYVYNK